MSDEGKVFGIDLGTTYSAIAMLDDNGMPVIIRNYTDNADTIASAVYFEDGDGGKPRVGNEAKMYKADEPGNVVEFAKRYIGRENAPEYDFFAPDGVKYNPTTISALILKRIVEEAGKQGKDVKNVVITCPAYFGNSEKTATRQAGEIAGLNVLNVVHEPTAAALSYCAREFGENRKIMVYDLGGGTFDITLLDFSVGENEESKVDVIRSGGDPHLGGVDWDEVLIGIMCRKYAHENELDEDEISDLAEAKIKSEAEDVKKSLSFADKKRCTISAEGDPITRFDVTKQEFEEGCAGLVGRTIMFTRRLLDDTGFTPADVDVVLLVGGSTKMPMIENAVKELFPGEGKVRVEDPDLAVAKGAALAAAIKLNEIVRGGGDISGPGSVPLPPGPHIVYVDRLTRSLGPAVIVSEHGDYMIDNLLFVGDEIPACAEGVYGSYSDNAPEIVVNVYENTSEDRINKFVLPCFDAQGNPQQTDPTLHVRHIGKVHLPLPPNTPKGYKVRVVFKSSEVGLEVTAEDVATGKQVTAVIKSDAFLSDDELSKKKNVFEGISGLI